MDNFCVGKIWWEFQETKFVHQNLPRAPPVAETGISAALGPSRRAGAGGPGTCGAAPSAQWQSPLHPNIIQNSTFPVDAWPVVTGLVATRHRHVYIGLYVCINVTFHVYVCEYKNKRGGSLFMAG
jgi:hypothetical protein